MGAPRTHHNSSNAQCNTIRNTRIILNTYTKNSIRVPWAQNSVIHFLHRNVSMHRANLQDDYIRETGHTKCTTQWWLRTCDLVYRHMQNMHCCIIEFDQPCYQPAHPRMCIEEVHVCMQFHASDANSCESILCGGFTT